MGVNQAVLDYVQHLATVVVKEDVVAYVLHLVLQAAEGDVKEAQQEVIRLLILKVQ